MLITERFDYTRLNESGTASCRHPHNWSHNDHIQSSSIVRFSSSAWLRYFAFSFKMAESAEGHMAHELSVTRCWGRKRWERVTGSHCACVVQTRQRTGKLSVTSYRGRVVGDELSGVELSVTSCRGRRDWNESQEGITRA